MLRSPSAAPEGDVLYPAVFAQAIQILSEKVPDPPTTHVGLEPIENDIIPWIEWWEDNREDYEGSAELIPQPKEGSLRLLSKEERMTAEARRFIDYQNAVER